MARSLLREKKNKSIKIPKPPLIKQDTVTNEERTAIELYLENGDISETAKATGISQLDMIYLINRDDVCELVSYIKEHSHSMLNIQRQEVLRNLTKQARVKKTDYIYADGSFNLDKVLQDKIDIGKITRAYNKDSGMNEITDIEFPDTEKVLDMLIKLQGFNKQEVSKVEVEFGSMNNQILEMLDRDVIDVTPAPTVTSVNKLNEPSIPSIPPKTDIPPSSTSVKDEDQEEETMDIEDLL